MILQYKVGIDYWELVWELVGNVIAESNSRNFEFLKPADTLQTEVISLIILEGKFDFEKKMRIMTKKSISLAKISHF